MSEHPKHDDLAALVFGNLPDDEAEIVALHVEHCAQCEETVQQLETESDEVIRMLRRPAVEHPFEQESGCRQMVELLGAMGREPSFGSQMPNDAVQAKPGDLGMLCEYHLQAKLGQGGMGTVYKALHTKLDKTVAVKVLPADKLQDERAVSRFEREMKAVGKLEHPNIVQALDAREVDGKHFLVMEYVDGLNLSEIVHRVGSLSIADACEIIRQAAHGLQYAHEHGLVHRDIKPSNLMLSVAGSLREPDHVPESRSRSEQPTLKILDFGLALLQAWQAEEADELTGSGQLMGTLDYMAPEQGRNSHDVDIRADIYSLGATLYKLLCGAAPFAGDKYDTPVKKVMALASEPVAPIRERRSDVPEELAAVLDRMLARNPEERLATPAEVATALAAWCLESDLVGLAIEAKESSAGTKTDVQTYSTEPHLSAPETDTTSSDVREPVAPAPVSATAVSDQSEKAVVKTAPGSVLEPRNWSRSDTDSPLSPGSAGERFRERGLSKQGLAGQRVRWMPFAICTCLAGLIILAVVIMLRTPDGMVEIVMDDGIEAEGVSVAIMQGAKEIRVADEEHGWTVDLKKGEYKLDLRDTSDRFGLAKDTVTVHRGKKEIVRITFKPSTKATADSKVAPSAPAGSDAARPQTESDPSTLRLSEISSAEPKEPEHAAEPKPQPLKIGPPIPRPEPVSIQLEPEPVDLQPGAPISRLALVTKPASLLGLRSWTIETIGHRGWYEHLAFSPDGKTMATCCKDDTIRLWDAKDGRFLRALVGHDGPINQVCWSPDGRILASSSDDRTVRLWDVKTGLRLFTLRGEDSFGSLAWSPDGRYFAGVTQGPGAKGIQLWEFLVRHDSGDVRAPATHEDWRLIVPGIRNRELLAPINLSFLTMAWSPDGAKLAAIGSGPGYYRIWLYDVESDAVSSSDILRERLAQALKSHPALHGQYGGVGVAWSPDGQVLACGELPVLLLDARLQELDGQIAAEARPTPNVYSMAWSPCGRHLAFSWYYGPSGNYVSVWDFELGRNLHEPVKLDAPRRSRPVTYAPDGKTLAVGWRLCDAESGAVWHTLTTHSNYRPVAKPAWSADGTLLATPIAFPLHVQVWDGSSGRLLAETNAGNGVGSIIWSPAGVLAMSDHGRIYTWNSRRPQSRPEGTFRCSASGHMSWSPDSSTFIAVAYTGVVGVYDGASHEELRRLDNTERKSRRGLAYSPNGEAVAFGEGDEVKICDPTTLEVEPLTSLPATICGLSWSPDGATLAVACDNCKVPLIDVQSKQVIAVCEGHETPAVSFGWSEDGSTLVTASDSHQGENGVCVWDAKTGKRLRTIPDGGEVTPDGRRVAWLGQSMIRLRETETGHVVSTLLSLRDSQYAAISPDGHFSGSPGVEKELVYVVQTDEGQFTLTPAEFAEKYGWKNDPEKVRLNLGAPAEPE